MPLGRPVVVLGEGMGSYWRDLGGGGFFCVRVVCLGYGGFLGGEILGGERDVQVAVLCVGAIAGFTYKRCRS